MKLRYVFPLMLAAAVVGGAAVHFRSEIEQLVRSSRDPIEWPQEKARQVFEAEHKRHYSNIADALIWLCSYDGTVREPFRKSAFAPQLEQIEREWHSETEKLKGNREVVRIGARLMISTAARQVEFVDSGYLCGSDGMQIWRYEQKLPKSGIHVINLGAQVPVIVRSVLVSPRSGDTAEISGALFESPSGKRIAGFAVEEGDSGGVPEIVRIDSHALPSEAVDLGNSSPVELVGWIDDDTLLLLLDNKQQATLVRRNGKWQFDNSSP